MEDISVSHNGFATFTLSSDKSIILDYPELYLQGKLRVDPLKLSSCIRIIKQDIDKARYGPIDKVEGTSKRMEDTEVPGEFGLLS